MIKQKKAQVYIFTAVLLCGVMLGLTVLGTSINNKGDDFKPLVNNYKNEMYYVMNNAVISGRDAADAVNNFTQNFQWYAAQKSLKAEVLTLVYNTSAITIINRFNSEIVFEEPGVRFTVKAGSMNSTYNFNSPRAGAGENYIRITAGNNTYDFVPEGIGLQVNAIIRHEDDKGNVQVYRI